MTQTPLPKKPRKRRVDAFEKKAIERGAVCCAFAFWKIHKGPDDTPAGGWSVAKIAKKLVLSTSCVAKNKAKMKDGVYKCEGKDFCLKQMAERQKNEKK